MPLTPQVTLTANLLTILDGDELAGYLEITLCGFGPICPGVAGAGMIADAGIPRLVGPQAGTTPISVDLWGNDVITPAGTFYNVSVLDEQKNVIQSNMFLFTGSGTLDLSEVPPISPPPGPAQIYSLVCNKLNGARPGTVFTVPTPILGNVLLVLYNGVGLRPPTDPNPDYTQTGIQITTNFTVGVGEVLYALYIQAVG